MGRKVIFGRTQDGAEGCRAVDGERSGTRFDDSCSFVFIRGQEKHVRKNPTMTRRSYPFLRNEPTSPLFSTAPLRLSAQQSPPNMPLNLNKPIQVPGSRRNLTKQAICRSTVRPRRERMIKHI